MTRSFTHEGLSDIVKHVREELVAHGTATIRVPNPDDGTGLYPGEAHADDHGAPRHRPLRVWTDLADRLAARLKTPVITDDAIELTFLRLDPKAVLLSSDTSGPGKYAPGSGFERADKLEDPDFLLDFEDALQRCGLPPAPAVLSLGVNCGRELEPIIAQHPDAVFTGVDHDRAALAVAAARHGPPHRFLLADLADLPDLPTFDLVVCIDTLQSPGVDDRAVLRHLVQHLLKPRGSVILGLPNCRYVDGELLHGARMLNFRQPELSLLLKGVAFYKKYLQQHHKRVFVTGKHELLITGTPIGQRHMRG